MIGAGCSLGQPATQKSEGLEIMDRRSEAMRFPISLPAAIAILVTGSPGSATVLNNPLMRSSLTLSAIAILLCPVWSSIGLLRAQGLLASRNSSGPRVAGPSAASNTQPAIVAGSALRDRVRPFRSSLRGAPAFIENRGQFDKNVSFQLSTGGSTLWLTTSGITFDTLRPKEGAKAGKSEGP